MMVAAMTRTGRARANDVMVGGDLRRWQTLECMDGQEPRRWLPTPTADALTSVLGKPNDTPEVSGKSARVAMTAHVDETEATFMIRTKFAIGNTRHHR